MTCGSGFGIRLRIQGVRKVENEENWNKITNYLHLFCPIVILTFHFQQCEKLSSKFTVLSWIRIQTALNGWIRNEVKYIANAGRDEYSVQATYGTFSIEWKPQTLYNVNGKLFNTGIASKIFQLQKTFFCYLLRALEWNHLTWRSSARASIHLQPDKHILITDFAMTK
jgi:hypothetical protein